MYQNMYTQFNNLFHFENEMYLDKHYLYDYSKCVYFFWNTLYMDDNCIFTLCHLGLQKISKEHSLRAREFCNKKRHSGKFLWS